MLSLPLELIFYVLNYSRDDWSTLKNISLTCQGLRSPAQSLIFRRIILDYSCVSRDLKCLPIPRHIALISANPTISAHIVEVEIRSSLWYREAQYSLVETLRRLKLERIQRCVLDFGTDCDHLDRRLQPMSELYCLLFKICRSPCLVSLHLNHAPYDIIRHCQPSLKDLTIDCPRTCYDRFRFESGRYQSSRLPVELASLSCTSLECKGVLPIADLISYISDPRSHIEIGGLRKLSISLRHLADFRCIPGLLEKCQDRLEELEISIQGMEAQLFSFSTSC